MIIAVDLSAEQENRSMQRLELGSPFMRDPNAEPLKSLTMSVNPAEYFGEVTRHYEDKPTVNAACGTTISPCRPRLGLSPCCVP